MLAKKLLAVFILIPLVEMFLLIKIGQELGVWATLILVIGLGALGFFLVKKQGLYVFHKVQSELAGGRLPADTLLDGALVLVGGLLLITPGVLTAGIGLIFMFPSARHSFRQVLKVWLANQLKAGKWQFHFK